MTVDNTYRLVDLKFSHLLDNEGSLKHLTIYFNMLEICIDTTKQNSYKDKVQSVSFMAIDIWKDTPSF